jgi:hypothetical protein
MVDVKRVVEACRDVIYARPDELDRDTRCFGEAASLVDELVRDVEADAPACARLLAADEFPTVIATQLRDGFAVEVGGSKSSAQPRRRC